MKQLSCIFLIFIIHLNASAKDTRKFTKATMIEVSWQYIQNTKDEFKRRAKAVEEEIGEKVEFTYTYFSNMDDDQKKFHQDFLNAKLSESKSKDHIKGFLKELEINRAALARAEKKAKVSWDKKNSNIKKKEENLTSEELYGTKISAKRLGVVLDKSGSMSSFLPQLRAEIKKKFPNSYFIEIYGSAFRDPDYRWLEYSYNYISPNKDENPFLKIWYCQEIPQDNPHYFQARLNQDNLTAIGALSKFRKVDAIYWFSDMKDRVDAKRVEHLKELLISNKTKFYAHTIGKYPTRSLSLMVKETGGKVIRKKLK